MGTQTESLHYYAKRRLPLAAIWLSLCGGACLREVAGRYNTSPMAMQNAVLRLGRQAMAAQAVMRHHLHPRLQVCFDGLRSFVTAQDYPCDITTVVDRAGETILSMTHTITRRGGRLTKEQQHRMVAKYRRWRPRPGSMWRELSYLVGEIWDYLRPTVEAAGVIDTDEHPWYRRILAADPCASHFRAIGVFTHRVTSGNAPRVWSNPLFPVNYVDRLLRHREKEHTRETIAFGRHASVQMHRAWIFAWDHNARRPWRVREPQEWCHAIHETPTLPAAVAPRVVEQAQREFFTRRIRVRATQVPRSMQRVWLAELPTPPVRWKTGQAGTTVRVPKYAKRDLAEAYQQGR
jgi:hypothetical protein